MKKSIYFLLLISTILSLFGCIGFESPKMRAKEFFDMYIENNKEIMIELDNFINNQDLNNNQKQLYKDIIKDNYTNLKYKILDEVIKGKTAYVDAEVKVKDLYTIEEDSIKFLTNNPENFYTEGKFNQNKFINYKLSEMKNRSDSVKYNIKLNLVKNHNIWFLKPLDDATLQKIHGTYKH